MELVHLKPDVDRFLGLFDDLKMISIQKGRFSEKDFLGNLEKITPAYRGIRLILSDTELAKSEEIMKKLWVCGTKFDNCKDNLEGEDYKKESESARALMEEMFKDISEIAQKLKKAYKCLAII